MTGLITSNNGGRRKRRIETMKHIVAVLHRLIPVEGYTVETMTLVCNPVDQVGDIIEWANRQCDSSASLVRLELTEAECPPELRRTNED